MFIVKETGLQSMFVVYVPLVSAQTHMFWDNIFIKG